MDLDNWMDANIAYGISMILGFVVLLMGVAGYLFNVDVFLASWIGVSAMGQMIIGAVLLLLLFIGYPFLVMKQKMDKNVAVLAVWALTILISWGLVLYLPLLMFGMARIRDYEPTNMVNMPHMSEGNWAGIGKLVCFVIVVSILLSALLFLFLGVSLIIPWG